MQTNVCVYVKLSYFKIAEHGVCCPNVGTMSDADALVECPSAVELVAECQGACWSLVRPGLGWWIATFVAYITKLHIVFYSDVFLLLHVTNVNVACELGLFGEFFIRFLGFTKSQNFVTDGGVKFRNEL